MVVVLTESTTVTVEVPAQGNLGLDMPSQAKEGMTGSQHPIIT